MAKILTLSLPRSITSALQSAPSLTLSILPRLARVLDQLECLAPVPLIEQAFSLLKGDGAQVLIITNGAKATTEGYVRKARLEQYVDGVQSCEDIGLAKPLGKVYAAAMDLCEEEGAAQGERWFVAAHMWDVCAARKAGYGPFLSKGGDLAVDASSLARFKTGVVLSEQPPLGKGELDEWWALWGGKPDVVGRNLQEVARGILAAK